MFFIDILCEKLDEPYIFSKKPGGPEPPGL